MKFIDREAQYPGRRKITKVDDDNVPMAGEKPFLVNIERAEGRIDEEGTPIDTENLNKGNWRDDDSLSFRKRDNNDLPDQKEAETQIITKDNGEIWAIPPLGLGNAKELTDDRVATATADGVMSAADKLKLDGIEASADVSKIKSVSINGTAVTPDANKNVNIVTNAVAHKDTHKIGGSDVLTPADIGAPAIADMNLKADKNSAGIMTNPVLQDYKNPPPTGTGTGIQYAFSQTPLFGVKQFVLQNQQMLDVNGNMPFTMLNRPTFMYEVTCSRPTNDKAYFTCRQLATPTDDYNPPEALMICAVSGETMTLGEWRNIPTTLIAVDTSKTFTEHYARIWKGRAPQWIRCSQEYVKDNLGRIPFYDKTSTWSVAVLIIPITATYGQALAIMEQPTLTNGGGRMAGSNIKTDAVGSTSIITEWYDSSSTSMFLTTSQGETMEQLFQKQQINTVVRYALQQNNCYGPSRAGGGANIRPPFGQTTDTYSVFLEIHKRSVDNCKAYVYTQDALHTARSGRNSTGWTQWMTNTGIHMVRNLDQSTAPLTITMNTLYDDMVNSTTDKFYLRNIQTDVGQGRSPSVASDTGLVLVELLKHDANTGTALVRSIETNTLSIARRSSGTWGAWERLMTASSIEWEYVGRDVGTNTNTRDNGFQIDLAAYDYKFFVKYTTSSNEGIWFAFRNTAPGVSPASPNLTWQNRSIVSIDASHYQEQTVNATAARWDYMIHGQTWARHAQMDVRLSMTDANNVLMNIETIAFATGQNSLYRITQVGRGMYTNLPATMKQVAFGLYGNALMSGMEIHTYRRLRTR